MATLSPSSHYTTFMTSKTTSPSSITISHATLQSSASGTPSHSNSPSQPSAIDTQPNNAEPDIPNRPGYRAVAYYGSWDIYTRNFQPQQIPAEHLTHLLFSFADNKPDGTVFLTDSYADAEKHYKTDSWNNVGDNLYGSLKQLQILKSKNRNLKVLLSIGGWTYTNTNKHMDGPMTTAAGRQRFASSCVEMIRDYGFDGIDVDWEYPKDKEQGHQWLELLREIRSQMNGYADTLVHQDDSGHESKPEFLLTIASPAGEKNYKHLPLKEISGVTDFINLMAYDYAGSWDKQTGHNSNLYPSTSNPLSTPFNTASVLAAYNAAGVPPSKLNLGMPLYGRSFTNTQGLGKSFNGIGDGSFEKGVYDYKDLPLAGAQEHYDEEAGASYSYDEGSGMLVSYDTVAMALKKVDYIAQQKLGGAMWWEISGDRRDNDGSIVANVVKKLGGSSAGIESSRNWLLYPDLRFDNIRNGVPTSHVARRLRRN
ncbi:chitinase [Alternaria panax]|uniref:chitinase n=1 Tax=Alternaria panax TaxID=48097 RepID=A0AAD4ID44_9PLEO|nr:chitinase [Alternaria panax]